MRRALVIFLTLFLLWTLLAQLNHAAAGIHLYIFLGGLYVTYAALVLPPGAGLGAVLLGGMLCDANTPVAFGTHALLFAVAHAVLLSLRGRLPHEDMAGRVVVALLANLGLFLLMSFFELGRLPVLAAAWPRLVLDLIASQLVLAAAGPWFFSFQEQVLFLSGGLESRLR